MKEQVKYMKLNEDFIIHNTGDETLLVPTSKASFHGLVQANESVDTILHCLTKDTTEDEIVSEMLKKYDADEQIIREDVRDVIDKLRKIGAINE